MWNVPSVLYLKQFTVLFFHYSFVFCSFSFSFTFSFFFFFFFFFNLVGIYILPGTIIQRPTYTRFDFICLSYCNTRGHIIVSDAFLYIYYQDHSKHSVCSEKNKSFSTCSSPMIEVSLTYDSCIFITWSHLQRKGWLSKVVVVIYTSVTPVLNPFIHTLRNQQVKQTFRDTLQNIYKFFNKWGEF